jgi:hypothetical protein
MSALQRFGWITFVAGSLVLAVLGAVNADWWVAFGGTLFVIGCIALYVAGTVDS